MSQVNLNSLMENLDSPQISRQIPAMDEATAIVETLAIKAVDSLKTSSNPFLVAERLGRFGSVIVPHLEMLIQDSHNWEVKILASLVLLQLNSQVGVPILLNAIEDNEEYAILAAQHLAQANVKEAIQLIWNRLRKSKLEQVDLIESLLASLSRLNRKLPQDLWQRFTANEMPWEIKTMCLNNFSVVENSLEESQNVYSTH
ncbi:MAG: hypothetical protein AAGE84_21920 [Cyanobacteria bacterium P01_G01_bin.39]